MASLQKIGENSYRALNLNQMGIGRETDNEIVINDDAVSGYHALITIRTLPGNKEAKEYIIEDLESTNKTYVNNKVITSGHQLRNGDIIRVGSTRLKFSTRDISSPEVDFQATRKL